MYQFTLNETLSTNEYYALLALVGKSLHGYGIRDQIAHDSNGALVIAPGAMYPLLHRLKAKDLIERQESDTARITYRYQLTKLGARRLYQEAKRLEWVVTHTRLKLGKQLLIPGSAGRS